MQAKTLEGGKLTRQVSGHCLSFILPVLPPWPPLNTCSQSLLSTLSLTLSAFLSPVLGSSFLFPDNLIVFFLLSTPFFYSLDSVVSTVSQGLKVPHASVCALGFIAMAMEICHWCPRVTTALKFFLG